jgi:soluble lytic murein transglycosylase-like protein
MACESGGNPNATGSAGERGLMQIHPLHADSTYDPEGNIRAAYRISGGGVDFSAWSCKG